MNRPGVVVALAASALGVAGCGRQASGAGGRPAVAVEVAEVRTGDLAQAVDVVGALSPKRAAKVKSEYSGIVAAVHVTAWVAVSEGQPLATLDRREAGDALRAARAALLQAQVAETRAARELERAEGLKAAGLLTRQGLEDARTAREAAAAGTELVRAQLDTAEIRVAKAVIRAPFDGVVAARGVDVGDRVEHMGAGEPLFEVVDNRVLELTMAVPSRRLDAVRVGQPVQFLVDAAPGRIFAGTVTYVNPSVDAGSRAGRVVAQVRNGDGRLRGGLFAKARIVTGERRDILQVPRPALQGWDTEAGTADVFVIAGGTARHRAVRTGAASGDLVEVTGGLAAGERVATRGAYNLREGDRVAVAAAPGE